jgi:hypothetical protein
MGLPLHDKVFHKYPVRQGVECRVVTSLFKGRWNISIREWYQDGDGEWCAGSKGITIGAKNLIGIEEGLKEAVSALRAAGVPLEDQP